MQERGGGRIGAKTYVLVHGAWHGGWCWREVARLLRALGHQVTTPTQTGLGERKHLLRRGITLDVFVADIVNHIESEELEDVILVGHSFGGVSISGAADRIAPRIRHLVYLDAVILESNQSTFGTLPADIVAARRKSAAEKGQGIAMPLPPPSAFGIPDDHPLADWVRRRMTPHPLDTYETTLNLQHPIGNGRPRTYVACTSPAYEPLQRARDWVKQQPDWKYLELASGHDAMVLAPEELSRVLAEIN
ncbi:MAG: alpha/beta fold hydrolase [Parvibaculaceae bacterium]